MKQKHVTRELWTVVLAASKEEATMQLAWLYTAAEECRCRSSDARIC
jgi:hypothetical protein